MIVSYSMHTLGKESASGMPRRVRPSAEGWRALSAHELPGIVVPREDCRALIKDCNEFAGQDAQGRNNPIASP